MMMTNCSVMVLGLLLGHVAVGQERVVETRVLHPEPFDSTVHPHAVSGFGLGWGKSVALWDDWLFTLAGNVWSIQPLYQAASIRVFKRTELGWVHAQDLRHPDPEGDYLDGYGGSIQVADGVALVAAPNHGSQGGTVCPDGRIYSFVLEGGVWSFKQTIRAPLVDGLNCPTAFGQGFAFDGSLLVAGAQSQIEFSADRSGMAYIYTRGPNDVFSLEQSISAPLFGETTATGGLFGLHSEVGDGKVFITISGGTGGVLLYESVAGVWTKTFEFVQPPTGSQDWGYAVAYDDSRLAVGSRRRLTINPSPRDFVRIYREQSPGSWILEQELWISGPGMNPSDFPEFSSSLDLDGDWLVVGAPGVQPVPVVGTEHNEGRVFVYHRNDVTGWNLFDDFSYSDRSDITATAGNVGRFGSSVVMDVERGQIAANAPGYRVDLGGLPSARILGGLYLFDLELGNPFCTQGDLNSAGLTSSLSVIGSSIVSDDNLTLHAHHLPANTTALFLFGQQSTPISLVSGGEVCLGGLLGIGRLPLSAPVLENGEAFLQLDFQSPFLRNHLTAGSSWGFQVWHREQGQSTHFTNAVSVTLD